MRTPRATLLPRRRWRRDHLFAIAGSLVLHVLLFTWPRERPPTPAPATSPPEETRTFIAVTLAEPVAAPSEDDPAPSEVRHEDLSDLAPPSLPDLPMPPRDGAFLQKMSPPSVAVVIQSTPIQQIPTRPPPSAAAAAARGLIFELAQLDRPPEVKSRPLPEYPYELQRSRISGSVTVEFIIDRDGNVREPRVITSTHQAFTQAALVAVARWKFTPGRKAGQPVSTRARQEIPFTLNV